MTPTQLLGALCVIAAVGMAIVAGVHRVGGRLELPGPAPREPQPARALGCRCDTCRGVETPLTEFVPGPVDRAWSPGDETDVVEALRMGRAS